MQSKTLTIMFVDMQGYTSLTSRQTREENQLLVREIREFIDRHAQSKHGRLVKSMGDGFLITFESPTDAINCGVAIQEEMRRRNASILNESHLLRLRVGISTGEVSIDEKEDVYGEAVNIAARIEKFCEPNEVFISESTYLAMNRSEINARDLGPLRFKNVSEDIRVFKVLREKQEPPRGILRTSWRQWVPWGISGVLAVLTIFALFLGRPVGERMPGSGDDREPVPVRRPRIDLREACGDAIASFCAEVQPGGGRIIRCLLEHQRELKPGCRNILPELERNPPGPLNRNPEGFPGPEADPVDRPDRTRVL
ncbi:MAG: hypothetical protein KTQ49_03310 [Candidatus Omnitrophica bacterium]|nr:hypothetical protein [Candidatus Omnitrophota bacterium]